MWGRSEVMTEQKIKKDYPPLNSGMDDYADTASVSASEEGPLLGSSAVAPLNYQDNPHGASNGSAVWNIVCTIAGVGILNLPKAMADSGWVGLVIMFISVVVADYSGRVLIKSLYVNRPSRLEGGYPEVGQAAFGRIGYYAVQMFHKSTLLGVCILFLILGGNNFASMCAGTSVTLTGQQWTLILGAVVWLPLITLKTIKEVGIVSLFGLLASAVTVVVVVAQSLVDYYNPRELDPMPEPPQKVPMVFAFSFATAFASMAFAYGGNAVYPHVEHSMRTPRSFGPTLTTSMILVTCMYFPTAVVGYFVYGDQSESPILDNLPDGWPKTAATAFITAHLILAYPMPMMPVVLELEPVIEGVAGRFVKDPHNDFGSKSARSRFWIEWVVRALARSVIVGLTIIIAYYVQDFGKFFDLVASVSNTALVFILPVLFYWKLSGISHISKVELLFGSLIILLGLAAGGIGTYNAILAFIPK